MSISISTNSVLPMSSLLLDMILSYLSHSLLNLSLVSDLISLSSRSTFLCVSTSAGDLMKFVADVNIFSKSASWEHRALNRPVLRGTQFLGVGSRCPSLTVFISKTSPSTSSFSVNATTVSFLYLKFSVVLRFIMTNGVTVSSLFSDKSAWSVYMYMLGCLDKQRLSGTIFILSFSSVLMLTSTTAQLLGGNLVVFFRYTAAFVLGLSSFVSAIFLKPLCNILVFSGVQYIPMQYLLAKSLPKITGLFKFSHTKNVCSKLLSPILILHLVHPSAPKLEPFAPTTDGS